MRIAPAQLIAFLKGRGWRLEKLQQFPNLLAFTHRLFKGRQLFLPESEAAIDYPDALELLISKLAQIERVSPRNLLDILEKTDPEVSAGLVDSMALQILKTIGDTETIPLSLANAVIKSSEIILMSGSCTAEQPKHYFRRIDNRISNEIYDRTVFNHTKRGSFVMSISCEITGSGEQLDLSFAQDAIEWTNSRRAFVAIFRGVRDLTLAINANRIQEFTEEVLNSETPVVSSNLCEALANIIAVDSGSGMNIDFDWSPYIPLPTDIKIGASIHVAPKIADDLYLLSETLKPKQLPLDDKFVGTVEALSGNIASSGEREGPVEFLILLKDGQSIRASASLTIEQYKLADQAHIGGAQQYILIDGKLNPRPRIWQFEEIRDFRLAIP